MIDLLGEGVPASAGAKARRLHWLAARGYQVPRGWAIVGDDAPGLAAALVPGRRYAVRSSANLEDGAEHSFAGQFHTELDVPAAEVPAAAARVRASAEDERAVQYLAASQIDPKRLRMAVIVQEMVAPVVSGVVFSRNPLTGLSETIVEAVAGRGDALVSEGLTPQRWVYRWGDPIDAPADALLDASTVGEIVTAATRIEREFGDPVDLEWVWDGAAVHWVQLRAIGGLKEVPVYSNRIAKEVLPGIIKPLVWSVNVPLVNSAWIDLFTEMIGPNDLRPDDLARPFGYRAYFDMGTIGRIFEQLGMPRDLLEVLLGFEGPQQPSFKPSRATLRHLPRMVAAAGRTLRYGRRVEELLPDLERAFAGFEHADLAAMTDREVLADVDRLFGDVRRAAYANIVVPLLMGAYYGGLRRRIEKHGVDATRVDLGGDVSLDPAAEMGRLHVAFERLADTERHRVQTGGYAALAEIAPALRASVDAFLARFGHFSESGNDFSAVPWREDRDFVVRMIAGHSPGGGDERQLAWDDATAGATALTRLVLDAWYRRARAFRGYRDAISFQYTRGYGLFRDRFLELGRRLAERGVLGAADDIWYLTFDEVRRLVAGAEPAAAELVMQRRAEIEAVRDVPMPEVIFGDEFVPAPASEEAAEQLAGIPTSRGRYRGPVRVVRGRDDFDAMEPGDVLVIPFSDVGWTPLFARAGAVVAESGGILSHSSIVAREYGIPCVVSVTGALQLPAGVFAVVDGYAGTVTLER